jgi:hypothetical protein
VLAARTCLLGFVALCAALGWPSGAVASTASVRISERFHVFGRAQEVAYVAEPGERNDVLVEPGYSGSAWIVRDPGAVIVAGPLCSSIDAHAVRCVATPTSNPMGGLLWSDVALGDQDDRARQLDIDVNRTLPFYADGGAGDDDLRGTEFGGELRGGPGDDRLTSMTGFARSAVLDGGGGRDELRGAIGNELLMDGDLDASGRIADTRPDLIDGGGGVDALSYAGRTDPVSVDLERGSGGGISEQDVIRNVEELTGGAGDDRLSGDDNANRIDGGPGRDVLSGSDGDDEFLRGDDRTYCGRGNDAIRAPRSADFLARDCEEVTSDPYGEQVPLPVHPEQVTRRGIAYRFSCPREYDTGRTAACSGTLSLREASGAHRLLASKPIPAGRWNEHRIRARFTPLGRRLVSRPGGVKVLLRVAIERSQPLRWTIRLKTRRRSAESRLQATVGARQRLGAAKRVVDRAAV